MVALPASFPAELAEGELDPQSPESRLLFDPSPEATIDWIETFLSVPTERGTVVPFRCYPQQKLMAMEQTGRDITVKGRQTRASSFILARNLRRMTTNFGLKCLVMTNKDEITAQFRARIEHHLNDLRSHGLDYPVVFRNKDELVIGKQMECRFMFASGEERVTGRGYSAHIVHASEVAWWKPESAGDLMGGIVPSVPGPPNGWMDLESTPNGAEGLFYEYAQDALSGDPLQSWRLHFYPWFLEPRYRAGTTEDCDFFLDREMLEDLLSSFTPDYREQSLMKEHDLDPEQILWRRWRKREMSKTGIPFEQEYVESITDCFITGSENFFVSPDGIDHISKYRMQCSDPIDRKEELQYRNSSISFYGPNLQIWEYPDPKAMYVGFCDLAEGGTSRDHDYSTMVVLNCLTRHHVATLRLKCAPSEFGAMACAVGQYYNWATIGGERGGYGSAALERIRDLTYPKVYYHLDYGSKKAAEPWIHPTQQHRDEILRVFREGVFEHSFHTRDKNLVLEMGTFDWQKVGATKATYKARARKRKHDDLVIAAAGAAFVSQRIFRFSAGRRNEEPEELIVGMNGLVMRRGPRTNKPMWMR